MTMLIQDFKSRGIVKKGQFTLKSGEVSDVYVDFREILSYPHLFQQVGRELLRCLEPLSFDLICGVPYAAIPLASYLAIHLASPMIMLRKGQKGHGTQKMIEGVFAREQNVVFIEDVVTTGSSLCRAVEAVRSEGLIVNHCVVLLCRDHRGRTKLQELGVETHSVFEMSDFYDS